MRALKWAAGLLIGAVVLAGSGLVALTYALDAGALTPRLLAAIEAATGRQAALGSVSLQLGLTPKLAVEGASLANLPGGSRPAMAQIRRMEASIALLPLLRGDIAFRSIAIDGADILLERLPNGTPNWLLRPAPREAAAPAAPDSPPATEAPRRAVSIGVVTLTDSRITLPDPRLGTVTVPSARLAGILGDSIESITARLGMQGLALDLSGSLPAAPAPLRATLAAGTNRLTIEGRPDAGFALDATLPDAAALRPLMAALAPAAPLPQTLPALTAQLRLSPDGQPLAATLHSDAVDLGMFRPGLALTRLDIAAPAPDQPATATIAGTQSGLPFTARLALAPASILLPGTAEAPLSVSLTAEAANARLEAQGQLARPRALQGATFDIRASVPDLAALAPVLPDPPPLHDVTLSAHITAEAALSGPVTLDKLQIAGPDLAAEGNLRLAPGHPLGVSGRLQIAHIDLDSLTQRRAAAAQAEPPRPAGPSPQAPATPAPAAPVAAERRVIPDIPLPLAGLAAWHGQVSVDATVLRVAREEWRDLRGTVHNEGGVLLLEPLAVTSPGGPVQGRLRIDTRQDPPAVALTLRSLGRGLDLAALRRARGEAPSLEGRAEVIIDMTARGSSTRALAATLSGQAGLAMVDGRVDHAGMLRLGPDLLRLLIPNAPREGVALRCLAVQLTARDGIARTRALLLETTAGRVEGEAALNLRDETIAARLLPDVQIFGVQVRAPVGIGGSFADPRIGVDPARALVQVIRDTAANRLWDDTTLEWLRGRITGHHPAGDCASQLRLARMGGDGPVPTAPAIIPGVPRELQGTTQELLRGLGGLLGGRR